MLRFVATKLRTNLGLLVTASTLIVAPNTMAQTSTPPTVTYDQAWMQAAAADSQNANGYASVGYSPAIFSIPNQPFTAQRVYKEWARNGTSQAPIISTTVTVARDNVGRIHYESSRLPGAVIVRISDPVTHLNFQYEVDPQSTAPPTAQQCTQPLLSQISTPTPVTPNTPAPNTVAPTTPATTLPAATKVELGSKQMEGTVAYGQQRTDYLDLQPGLLTMQTLSWFSPDLGLMLLQTSDYSNQNKFTESTQNLQLGDPDPGLFALPAGYTLTGTTVSCVPLLNP